MRLAVLSSADSWYVRDLQRAKSGGQQIEALPFTRMQSFVDRSTRCESAAADLSSFDAVLVRTMPPGSLEQVVFRMDALQRLEANGTRVVNPAKAVEAAVDKYLTLSKLQAAGFEVPRTEVSQTIEEAMSGFERLGGDIVLKPLFGSEGRGMTRINDAAIAERTFKLLIRLGAVIYQQEFIEHEGYDIRLFVMGQDVYGMRRSNKLDWRTNVSQGASSSPLEVTNELTELALLAVDSVHCQLAGVDLLPARDGRLLAIEVNAVPGWRALSNALEIDIAQRILAWLEATL